MSLIPGIDSSVSALTAERTRLDVVANNLANAQNTSDGNGQVYRRKLVVFSSQLNDAMNSQDGSKQVVVSKVMDDPSPLERIYMPGHPKADADGMVAMPNVNPLEEMVDMMTANRSYEANLQAIQTGRSMFEQSLRLMT